jgi:DNA invertase Pin-like site-specific DNA recombinase
MLIGYGRVSTTDQDPEMQVAALKAAGCEKIFAETASGAKLERPELMAALAFMRPGDTLVVWKLDRLARSVRQLIDTAELLKSKAMGLKSLTETIDTATAGGEFIFTVFAALAQFERSLIRERTNEGLANARAKGRHGRQIGERRADCVRGGRRAHGRRIVTVVPAPLRLVCLRVQER